MHVLQGDQWSAWLLDEEGMTFPRPDMAACNNVHPFHCAPWILCQKWMPDTQFWSVEAETLPAQDAMKDAKRKSGMGI